MEWSRVIFILKTMSLDQIQSPRQPAYIEEMKDDLNKILWLTGESFELLRVM